MNHVSHAAFCRVAFGEPRRTSIFIDRMTELEALGILWLELRAGVAVEKGLKDAS
jgi:hypothetical protein